MSVESVEETGDGPTGSRSAEDGSNRLRVLVCTDSETQRRGLMGMLEQAPRVTAIGTLSPEAVLRLIGLDRYDVFIVAMNCLELPALRAVLTKFGDAGVRSLVLVRAVNEQVVASLTGLSADGFILEDDLTGQSLSDALGAAMSGTMPMPGRLASRLVAKVRLLEQTESQRPAFLTPRERQVLGLLGEGMGNKQIARSMDISLYAAKRHVGNVLAKLNCPNRTLAVAYAMRRGIIDARGVPPGALAPPE
ncbi:MAG: response regulator transcription factor [Actinocatenispora sp.]